ncbi:hypothetical protein GALMADRAFT_135424 [Galerina marginata CBS 339.88]|uniref:Uncharacterized protein n=1 Tax=Galerina marginata (strain CBS 339.88) TaxID=685588 RepID=A0A067TSV8_GALM3|nr:hypothetical protein GALMADRAFT_135424 [Galerina marginata CBS 339.88]
MSTIQYHPTKDAVLSKLHQKRSKCKAEREVLAHRMEELDQELSQIEAECAAVHNACIPLLMLPMEITCIIFHFALGYHTRRHREPYFEVIASHVCRRWRSISLTYPRLWASFCHAEDSHHSPDRLDAYLDRSGPLGLELCLNFRKTCLDDQLVLLEKTLNHAERWKFFTVFGTGEEFLIKIPSKIKAVYVPNLKHFTFSCEAPRHSDEDLNLPVNGLIPTIFRNGAPKLQSVTFDCSSVACLPSLSNVTTLRLEYQHAGKAYRFPWATFLLILTLPSLVNLSLVGDVFRGPHPLPPDLIAMNNLVHLRCSYYGDLPPMLHLLRAPLLQTLIIHNDWFGSPPEASANPYVFPSLRSVAFINTKFDSFQSAWYFAQLTELAAEVLISAENNINTVFWALQRSVESSNRIYWSKVKRITCNLGSFGSWDDVVPYLHFARARPKNDLVIRIFESLDQRWRQKPTPEYAALKEACTIELMDAEDNPFAEPWPPGERNLGSLHDNCDPFKVDPYQIRT